jgi:hypothetical protein
MSQAVGNKSRHGWNIVPELVDIPARMMANSVRLAAEALVLGPGSLHTKATLDDVLVRASVGLMDV